MTRYEYVASLMVALVGIGATAPGCTSEVDAVDTPVESDGDELRRKGSCVYDGSEYANGDGFPSSDGCNTCSCDTGRVICTKRMCVVDVDAAAPDATTLDSATPPLQPADAGADADADAATITDAGVATGDCAYGNKLYSDGARFPSTDGCNTCVCASGSAICTKRACRFDASVP